MLPNAWGLHRYQRLHQLKRLCRSNLSTICYHTQKRLPSFQSPSFARHRQENVLRKNCLPQRLCHRHGISCKWAKKMRVYGINRFCCSYSNLRHAMPMAGRACWSNARKAADRNGTAAPPEPEPNITQQTTVANLQPRAWPRVYLRLASLPFKIIVIAPSVFIRGTSEYWISMAKLDVAILA